AEGRGIEDPVSITLTVIAVIWWAVRVEALVASIGLFLRLLRLNQASSSRVRAEGNVTQDLRRSVRCWDRSSFPSEMRRQIASRTKSRFQLAFPRFAATRSTRSNGL